MQTHSQPGDRPGWTGDYIAAPDPRTAVHRGIVWPVTMPQPHVATIRHPSRPTWATTIALAIVCLGLGAFVATLAAMPQTDATRVARMAPR